MHTFNNGIVLDPEINLSDIRDSFEAKMNIPWARAEAALRRAPPNSMLSVYPDRHSRTIMVEIRRPDLVDGTLAFVQRQQGGNWTLNIGNIRAEEQGQGTVRRLFPHFIQMAKGFGVVDMSLRATSVGRYSWVKFGFIPCAESWTDLSSKAKQLVKIDYRNRPDIVQDISKICCQPNPAAIRRLARYKDGDGPDATPVGKAILLDLGLPAWTGRLDVNNGHEVSLSLTYCRGKALRPSAFLSFESRQLAMAR